MYPKFKKEILAEDINLWVHSTERVFKVKVLVQWLSTGVISNEEHVEFTSKQDSQWDSEIKRKPRVWVVQRQVKVVYPEERNEKML